MTKGHKNWSICEEIRVNSKVQDQWYKVIQVCFADQRVFTIEANMLIIYTIAPPGCSREKMDPSIQAQTKYN
jgi:hypothetical protein